MDKKEKNEKGFLSGAFGTVVKLGVGAGLMMVAGPLFADMGTWMPTFHDESNLRAKAFQMTMAPLTDWIPFQMGLTEPGGIFYNAMTDFIQPKLDILLAQKEAAEQADIVSNAPTNSASPSIEFEDALELNG